MKVRINVFTDEAGQLQPSHLVSASTPIHRGATPVYGKGGELKAMNYGEPYAIIRTPEAKVRSILDGKDNIR